MKNIPSGVYKTSDLEKILGHRVAISQVVDSGEIELFSRGYYRTSDLFDDNQTSAMIIEKYFPEAVVSKQTALRHYGLFDDPGEFFNVDIPAESVKVSEKGILAFHRSRRIVGVAKAKVNGVLSNIYTPERAVFEILLTQKGLGPDVVQVVNNYLSLFDNDGKGVSRLSEFAPEFGKAGRDLLQLAINLRQIKSVY